MIKVRRHCEDLSMDEKVLAQLLRSRCISRLEMSLFLLCLTVPHLGKESLQTSDFFKTRNVNSIPALKQNKGEQASKNER